jgi:hypothetical protein
VGTLDRKRALHNNAMDEIDAEGHTLLEKQEENEHSTESNQIEVDMSVGPAGANANITDFKI